MSTQETIPEGMEKIKEIQNVLEAESKKENPDNIQNVIQKIFENFKEANESTDQQKVNEHVSWLNNHFGYLAEKYKGNRERDAYLAKVREGIEYFEKR